MKCFIVECFLSCMFEQEEAYVEFLRVRRVPLEERKSPDDICYIVPQVVHELMFESYSFHLCIFGLYTGYIRTTPFLFYMHGCMAGESGLFFLWLKEGSL